MSDHADWFNLAARRKLGIPEFCWHTLEAVDKRMDSTNRDALVIGGIPIGILSKGPYKGRPKFGPRSTDIRLVITDAEREAEMSIYERETGKCSTCEGSGRRTTGFSVKDGRHTVPCAKCNATGVATVVAT